MKKILTMVVTLVFISSYIGAIFPVSAATTISNTAATTILSTAYDRAIDGLGIDGGIYVKFLPGKWLEYDVTAPSAGDYYLYMEVGAPSDSVATVLVNGTTSYSKKIGLTGSGGAAYTALIKRFVAKISLNAGSNTIRLTNTGTGGGYFTKMVLDVTPTHITQEGITTISAFDFSSSISTLNFEGGNISFNANSGKWLEYYVYAENAGIYDFSMTIASTAGVSVTALVNGTDSRSGILTSTGAYTTFESRLLTRISLLQGVNTIRVTGTNNGGYLKAISFEKSYIKVNKQTETRFASYQYMRSNPGTYPNMVIEASYISFKVGQWVEYDLSVTEAGVYEIYMDVGTPSAITVGVTVDSEDQFNTVIASTGGYIPTAKSKVTSVWLDQGYHTIRLANVAGGYYFDYVTIAYDADAGEEFDMAAISYRNAVDGLRIDGGQYISFQPGNWVEYEVAVPSDAKYELYMGVGAPSNVSVDVVVNGTATFTGTAASTGDYFPIVSRHVTLINLTAGKNTIRINNLVASCYFETLKLVKYRIPVNESGVQKVPAYQFMRSSDNLRIEVQHISFQTSDWVEYDVDAAAEGLYDIYMDIGTPYAGTADIIVNGTNTYPAVMGSTGSDDSAYGVIVKKYAAQVQLFAGANTIKIVNTSNSMYFDYIYFTVPVAELSPSMTVQGEEYNLGGQNISYYDTTLIGGVEFINDDTAMELLPNEWFKYDVTVNTPGYYQIKLGVASTEATIANVSVNGQAAKTLTLPATADTTASDFVTSDGLVFLLKAGVNTFKIGCTSGTYYLDYFNLYQPKAMFLDANENELLSVNAGTMQAKVTLGGIFAGETVDYTFAIYKVDVSGKKQLVKVARSSALVDSSTVLQAQIDNITLDQGYTYTAKVFIWNNMIGNSYAIGQS